MGNRRRQTYDRRDYMKAGTVLGGTLLAGCIGGGEGGEDDQEVNIIAGGGSSDSTEFSGVQTFTALVDEKSDRIRMTAQTSSGTTENMRLIDSGQIDVGIAPTDSLYAAINETGAFEEQPLSTIPEGGFTMGNYEGYMMALEGTGIETYGDLRGKNVWPTWPGAAFRDYMEEALTEIGIWNDMNLINVGAGEITGLISEGRVDAFMVFTTSGNIGLYNEELDGRSDVNFHPVQMSEENWNVIADWESPRFLRRSIKGWSRDFEGTEVVMSVTSNNLMFHPSVSTDVGYELTKLAHENGKRLSEDAVLFPDISDPEMLTTANIPSVPIQEGVANYYKEIGAWNDDWQVA